MNKIKFEPKDEEKFIEYWTTIIQKSELDLKTWKEQEIPEYWNRYLGNHSVVNKEKEPFVNSFDYYPSYTTTTCTAMESRFNGAVRDSQKIVKITSKKYPDRAKNIEEYINNSLKKEVRFNDITGDGFQRDIVEGLLILFISIDEREEPNDKYPKDSGIKDKIKYVVDKVSKTFKLNRNKKIKRKLKWDLIKATDLIYSSGADSAENAKFLGHRLHMDFYDMKRKIKIWDNIETLLKKLGQKNPNYNPSDTQMTSEEDQSKQEYFMLPTDMVKEYKGLYFICGQYNINNEVKDICFIINTEQKILHLIYENEFIDRIKPYAIGQCFRITGQIPGQSFPKRMAESNDLLAELIILTLNNAKLTSSTGGKYVGMGKGFDPEKIDPSKWIEVTSLTNKTMEKWDFGNPNMDLVPLIQITVSFLEKIGYTNDSTMGLINKENSQQTARGTLALIQEYAKNIGLLIKNFQEVLRKAIYYSLLLKYQYMTPEDEKEDGLLRSDLEDLEDFNIEVIGEAVAAMDMYKKQIIKYLFETFIGDQSGETNTYNLKEALYDEYAPELKNKLLKSPQEIEKLKQMMAIIQQKAQEVAMAEQGLKKQAFILKAEAEAMIYEKQLRKAGVSEESIPDKVEEYKQKFIENEYPKFTGEIQSNGEPTPKQPTPNQ